MRRPGGRARGARPRAAKKEQHRALGHTHRTLRAFLMVVFRNRNANVNDRPLLAVPVYTRQTVRECRHAARPSEVTTTPTLRTGGGAPRCARPARRERAGSPRARAPRARPFNTTAPAARHGAYQEAGSREPGLEMLRLYGSTLISVPSRSCRATVARREQRGGQSAGTVCQLSRTQDPG